MRVLQRVRLGKPRAEQWGSRSRRPVRAAAAPVAADPSLPAKGYGRELDIPRRPYRIRTESEHLPVSPSLTDQAGMTGTLLNVQAAGLGRAAMPVRAGARGEVADPGF